MSSDGVINRFTQALEGIPRMIANALSKPETDLKKRVESEINILVSEFNVEKVVREVGQDLLHNALTDAIKNHFASKSAQQTLNAHVDTLLSKKETVTPEQIVTSGNLSVTTTPVSDLTDTTSIKSEVFSDPLTLQELKSLAPTVTPIENFSPLSLTQAIEALADSHAAKDYVLITTSTDAKVLDSDAFQSFFDPVTKVADLEQGQIGSIFGMEVYSDARVPESSFITQTGLLKRPVEVEHTTATQENMAQVSST